MGPRKQQMPAAVTTQFSSDDHSMLWTVFCFTSEVAFILRCCRLGVMLYNAALEQLDAEDFSCHNTSLVTTAHNWYSCAASASEADGTDT